MARTIFPRIRTIIPKIGDEERQEGVKNAKPPSYPALLLTQNQHRFYFFTIPVEDLFPYCFVARRGEDPISGFQRSLSEDRADDIALYLSSGSGSIPSNIVLSAQTASHFRYSNKTKSVSFSRVPECFLVLDGQHRLWGYQKSKVRHRVPVAVYENLSRAEEARLFIDINTNQKGVPATLLLDIKRLAEMEKGQDGVLRDLFDSLAKHSGSPVAGKLSSAVSAPGKISRVSFNRSIAPLLEQGAVLDELPFKDQCKLLRNYLSAWDIELEDKHLISRAAFFEAIFEVMEEVVRMTLGEHGDLRQESLQKEIRFLAKFDYSGPSKGVSKLTKKGIVATMRTILRRKVKISGAQF